MKEAHAANRRNPIRKWLLLASVLIGGAVLSVLLLRTGSQPNTAYTLVQGTVIQLDKAAKGRKGTFVIGSPVQRKLWHWFGGTKLQRGLGWIHVERPLTNTTQHPAGDGMLWFWFKVRESEWNGFQLRDYLMSNNVVEIVNRQGGTYTNEFYPGVPPDASQLFFRIPGAPTNDPVAVRFLARRDTNWETVCEVPIERLRDFTKPDLK